MRAEPRHILQEFNRSSIAIIFDNPVLRLDQDMNASKALRKTTPHLIKTMVKFSFYHNINYPYQVFHCLSS